MTTTTTTTTATTTTVLADCAYSFSECTTACELGSSRVVTIDRRPSGLGKACPSSAPLCSWRRRMPTHDNDHDHDDNHDHFTVHPDHFVNHDVGSNGHHTASCKHPNQTHRSTDVLAKNNTATRRINRRRTWRVEQYRRALLQQQDSRADHCLRHHPRHCRSPCRCRR